MLPIFCAAASPKATGRESPHNFPIGLLDMTASKESLKPLADLDKHNEK